MKTCAILLFVVAAASANFFEDGKEYEFQTESAAASGTMDYSPHTSGFSYKYKTRIQVHGNKIGVQISNLKFSQFNGGHVASSWPFDQTDFLDVSAETIPAFTVEVDGSGLFTKLSYPSSVNVFQANLIKGWAQILQINKGKIASGEKGFTSSEKLLHGDCDVTYTVNEDEIIKTVAHLKDCKNRVYRQVDEWGGYRCDAGPIKEKVGGFFSNAVTVYKGELKGDRFAIKAISSSGTVMSQMFETEGVSNFAFTNSTSILTNVKSSGGDISGSGISTSDLLYKWTDEHKWDQQRNLKDKEPFFYSGQYFSEDSGAISAAVKRGVAVQLQIIKDLGKNKESLEKSHRYGINTVLPAMYALDYDSLMSIADELYADKSEDGVFKSNVFNELLASTGTSASALVVKDMVMQSKFDNHRDAIRVLSGVPFHIRRPTKQLVEEYEELLNFNGNDLIKDQIPLIFGHLVRKVCDRAGPDSDYSPEKKRCSETFATKYVNQFASKLQSGADHAAKSVAISALHNIRHGGVLEKLRPVIYGESDVKCSQMRSAAIWASGYDAMVSGKAVETFLPIFANHDLDHEIRIAAITMVFYANPDTTQMSNVMAVLYTEKDYEVINYVFTLLERYANTLNPCKQEFAEVARYFLKYLRQWSEYETDWGFGVSKTYTREFEKKKYGYGGSYTYYTIGSHKSTTPLIVGVGLGSTMFNNYDAHFLHVHLRIEGLAKGLIRKLKTIDANAWKTADLKKILSSDMSIREREDQPVKVEVIVMIKGVISVHRQYDETSTREGGNVKNFMDKMMGIADTYSVNHQRVMQVGGLIYEQPTEIGFPMAYMNSFTIMASFKANVKKGNNRGLLYRDAKYTYSSSSQALRIMMVNNPFKSRSYGIVNDRIYKMHIPRELVVGVNPVKKEFKLSIKRPSYDKPLQLLMHSQTTVVARDNSITGDMSIKDNCPTCENRVLVSNGPDAATDRVFIDRENQKVGSYLRGEYFDCELDVNRGRTVGHLLGAFMPYNKNPKTLYNSITMGLRQIRAFFLYFPKAEKCGALVRWSQSRNNPVREIEVSVRVNAEPNGERLFFRGRKIFVKTIIKAKGEPADRIYRVNMGLEFKPGNLENNFKLQIQRAAVPNLMDDFSMCVNYENKYPDFSDEFMDYDKNSQMEVTGKARLRYGNAADCDSAQGEIRATFKHQTTALAREDMKNTWYYKKCMEQKNTAAWSGRGDRLPVTEACYMVVWDATTARKYNFDIEFVKMTDRMKAIVGQFQTTFKAGLLPYWDIDMELMPTSNPEPHMKVEAEFKNNDKNVDLFMETSQGGQKFEDIPLKLNWYNRMRNLKFTKTLKRLMNAKIINPCVVTSQDIRTMDNVTYSYTPNSCWTLASAHCSDTPTYAVFTKKSSGLPLAMRAYFGGHLVEFVPSGPKKIDVMINGQKKTLNNKEYTHTSNGQEIFKIYQWGSTYNVYSFLKVWVVYDGHFANIVPAPSVKGQHCGMCGNYNRNKKDEFTGKNENLLTSSSEMVNEYKWKC